MILRANHVLWHLIYFFVVAFDKFHYILCAFIYLYDTGLEVLRNLGAMFLVFLFSMPRISLET